MKTILLILCVVGGFSAAKMTGGWKERNTDEKDIQNFAIYAAAVNAKKSNSLFYEKVVNITKARSQVVAGIKYDLTFETAPTECKKNDKTPTQLSECALQKCGLHQFCNATIWSREWLQDTRVLNLSCRQGPKTC